MIDDPDPALTDAKLEALLKRIEELEQSNAALWRWVKVLPVQDAMLIELMIGLHKNLDHDWPATRERIISQIVDNSRTVQGLPLEDDDE